MAKRLFTPKELDIYNLYCCCGHTQEAIARIMGVDQSCVSRALQRLKRRHPILKLPRLRTSWRPGEGEGMGAKRQGRTGQIL